MVKSLYEKDFYKWSCSQASHIAKKEFNKLDIDNLVDEIESLGKAEKRLLKSSLISLLTNFLKMKYKPAKTNKLCQKSILNAQFKIEDIIEVSPSLKKEIPSFFEYCYSRARDKAMIVTGMSEKTFPKKSPWKLKEILNSRDIEFKKAMKKVFKENDHILNRLADK